MGNQHSLTSSRLSAASLENNSANISSFGSSHGNRTVHLREHKRYGVVNVKITNISTSRRSPENTVNHTITPRGTIIYGSVCNPFTIQKGKISEIFIFNSF